MMKLLARRSITFVATSLCLSLAACASTGARPSTSMPAAAAGDWTFVRALPVGATLDVEHDGLVSAGAFESADPDRLRVRRDGVALEIPRTSVRRVVQRTRDRGAAAIRGLIVGAAAGAAQGALLAKTNRVPWMLMLGAVWSGWGASIGALVAPERRVTIYVAAAPGGVAE